MTKERSERSQAVENIVLLPQGIGVNVEPKSRAKFDEHLLTWREAALIRQKEAVKIEELEEASRKKLAQVLQVREAVIQAEARLSETRAILSKRFDDTVQDRDEIIKGRIRMLLAEINLPWYARPFKGLIYRFVGGEPVKLHPALKEHADKVREADTKVGVVTKEYEAEADKIVERRVGLRELDDKIDKARKQVVKDIVAFHPSRGQILRLIAEFPQEQDIIVNAYVEQNAFSPQELANFDEFLSSTSSLRWHTLSPEQQTKWRVKKCPWAKETRVPTPQEMNASDDLIRLWKQFVRRRFLNVVVPSY